MISHKEERDIISRKYSPIGFRLIVSSRQSHFCHTEQKLVGTIENKMLPSQSVTMNNVSSRTVKKCTEYFSLWPYPAPVSPRANMGGSAARRYGPGTIPHHTIPSHHHAFDFFRGFFVVCVVQPWTKGRGTHQPLVIESLSLRSIPLQIPSEESLFVPLLRPYLYERIAII